MIIFHEGLPRSGKSYEAVVFHIIAALSKGRKVFAYVEGLDHEKIAPHADLTTERCHELLVHIERDQVKEIYRYVENDSLVVIDEVANFWPDTREKLPQELLIFIKEHGHRGLDILLMDQVANDCHKMWKGRIDTKFVFRKLDSIGKENSYKWVAMKRLESGKFQETTSGVRVYDQKYFGTYKSHTEGTANTGNYADSRANVKNSKAWKLLKVYGVVALVAIAFVVWFFKSGGGIVAESKPKEPAALQKSEGGGNNVPSVSAGAGKGDSAKPVAVLTSYTVGAVDQIQDDLVDKLCGKYRLRLAGVVIGKHVRTVFEWRDDSGRVFDRMDGEQLRGLGWYVMVSSDGGLANITKPGKSYVATQWPIEDEHARVPEKVPKQTLRKLSNDAGEGLSVEG